MAMEARIRDRYRSDALPMLMREFEYGNAMQVPRLVKIVVNVGLGEASENAKVLDGAVTDIATITGQRPVVTRAKKAISNFKLREGVPVGCSVTLRGNRMYEFFDRLVNFALPRVRDFRGVPDRSFDGRGNYSLGIHEHTIFTEVDLDKVEKIFGMTICIVTTATTDAEGKALLRALGMPFRS
jgi:large subunit ribosomal protein L5